MSVLPPRRRRKMAFMLTPLVDVMFLLLIFFMVSSQTAPYALLTVSEPQPPATDQPAEPAPQPLTPVPAATTNQVLISISNGYVRFNGSRVEAADLDAAIARFMGQGATSAMIMTTAGAKVQDVVSVIQAFQDAHFPSTQLMMEVATQ